MYTALRFSHTREAWPHFFIIAAVVMRPVNDEELIATHRLNFRLLRHSPEPRPTGGGMKTRRLRGIPDNGDLASRQMGCEAIRTLLVTREDTSS